MIFLDTSAIYALADRADPHHDEAKVLFRDLLAAGQPILTQNYVLVESMVLLGRRLGSRSALELARDAAAFDIEWVDAALHRRAVDRMKGSRRGASLVDQVSFLVMRARGAETAFAFDPHFEAEGFRLLGL